jgi:hypothetical protein
MPDDTPHIPEHSRRSQVRYSHLGLDAGAARWRCPLVGGGVGIAIVVVFLALRGGDPGPELNELTGTARGGWNREQDILLAIVAGGAATAGIAVSFLAEYVRHWTSIFVLALLGATLLSLRELRAFDNTTAAVLLALTIVFLAAGLGVALFDTGRHRRRTGD